jgi:hypothetical protein
MEQQSLWSVHRAKAGLSALKFPFSDVDPLMSAEPIWVRGGSFPDSSRNLKALSRLEQGIFDFAALLTKRPDRASRDKRVAADTSFKCYNGDVASILPSPPVRRLAFLGRLVAEFQASGSRAAEFRRDHVLALSTLQRHLKRRRLRKGEARTWSERFKDSPFYRHQ